MHFLMAFSLALLLVVALRPLGRKFGIYDVPDRRKNHNRPVVSHRWHCHGGGI